MTAPGTGLPSGSLAGELLRAPFFNAARAFVAVLHGSAFGSDATGNGGGLALTVLADNLRRGGVLCMAHDLLAFCFRCGLAIGGESMYLHMTPVLSW